MAHHHHGTEDTRRAQREHLRRYGLTKQDLRPLAAALRALKEHEEPIACAIGDARALAHPHLPLDDVRAGLRRLLGEAQS